MTDLFMSGGVMMWPILAVATGVLWLSGKTALGLRNGEGLGTDGEVRRGLQAILFWGGMAVVLGFLGMVVGLVQVAQAIRLAGAVEAPLVWGGVGVALVTLIFGLLVFVLSATGWFVLHQWSGRVRERREAVAGG